MVVHKTVSGFKLLKMKKKKLEMQDKANEVHYNYRVMKFKKKTTR
jgi:hypothetical protein